ncbi:MAG TPA: TRAFs-binding domain-containing protein [Pyrinomonadaceae bacterium]|nr:TRAFs-binding domain-containing protein [Pyrinomonadaceae bacterium]
MSEEPAKKKCFVVMGFGTKTDFQQQKAYDLDKTYRTIIRAAVNDAGLECIRADDVIHAGIIDKPMYELLLNADVVVADVSTSNANAIYELGVRHALRPYTTIVIAEQNFKFPFDIGHLLIRPYKHGGEYIDAEDAANAREALAKAIKELVEKNECDSPVHTFLPSLLKSNAGEVSEAQPGAPAAAAAEPDQTVTLLMKMFRQARSSENWAGAKMALEQLKTRMPGDPFIVQQLALATYKGKQPDKVTALAEAKKIVLEHLQPETSNDPETLGIWGSIHKQLWDMDKKPEDLEESVRSYGKGFHLKDDYYNGINYAFMLNVRAAVAASTRDAIADFVWAERVRHRVIKSCEERLAAGVKDEAGNVDREQLFWLRATLIEALVGTGDIARAESLKDEAIREAPEPWMPKTLEDQLAKLKELIANAPS